MLFNLCLSLGRNEVSKFDYYLLDEDYSISVNPACQSPRREIALDPAFYSDMGSSFHIKEESGAHQDR